VGKWLKLCARDGSNTDLLCAGSRNAERPARTPAPIPIVVVEEKKTDESDVYGELTETLTEAALSVIDNGPAPL
jgi:hypothetical protein